jgi:hypothetical protein
MRTKTKNKRKHTPIPLLALQMAVFNTYPSKQHKDALAIQRARIADRVYGASFPTRERIK